MNISRLKNHRSFALVLCTLLAICSCKISTSEVFCDNSGIQVTEPAKIKDLLHNGAYYSFNVKNGKNVEGKYFFQGRKVGTVRYNNDNSIYKEIFKTKFDNTKSIEMEFYFTYIEKQLSKIEIRMNGVLNSEIELKYANSTISSASIVGKNVIMSTTRNYGGDKEKHLLIEYSYLPKEVGKIYKDLSGKYLFEEKMIFGSSNEVVYFIDPITCYDISEYIKNGMKIISRKYYVGSTEIDNTKVNELLEKLS